MTNIGNNGNRKLIHLAGNLKDLIPEVLKLSIFAYILGFIIVNAAFMKYGFMIYDVASPKYLIAGMLFFIICLLTSLTLFMCKNKMKGDRLYVYYIGIFWLVIGVNLILNLPLIKSQNEYNPRWTYLIPNLCFFCGVILSAIFLKYHINKRWLRTFVKVSLIIFTLEFFILHASEEFVYLVIFIFIIIFFSSLFFIEIKKIKEVISLQDLTISNSAATFFLAMIFVPYIFGLVIYPKIDRMRGGGAPLRAQLIMYPEQKNELVKSFSDCDINFGDSKLIYETPDSVFIALKRFHKKGRVTLEIPKKNLIAIKYFKNKY